MRSISHTYCQIKRFGSLAGDTADVFFPPTLFTVLLDLFLLWSWPVVAFTWMRFEDQTQPEVPLLLAGVILSSSFFSTSSIRGCPSATSTIDSDIPLSVFKKYTIGLDRTLQRLQVGSYPPRISCANGPKLGSGIQDPSTYKYRRSLPGALQGLSQLPFITTLACRHVIAFFCPLYLSRRRPRRLCGSNANGTA